MFLFHRSVLGHVFAICCCSGGSSFLTSPDISRAQHVRKIMDLLQSFCGSLFSFVVSLLSQTLCAGGRAMRNLSLPLIIFSHAHMLLGSFTTLPQHSGINTWWGYAKSVCFSMSTTKILPSHFHSFFFFLILLTAKKGDNRSETHSWNFDI